MLISEEEYKNRGVEVGTHQKNADMQPYIHRVREDGLYILDTEKIDARIELGAKFLAKHEPSKLLVVATREYAQKPAKLFAEQIGAVAVVGRFIPGTLTNPNLNEYLEPEILLVSDPVIDRQALSEAVNVGIPVVAFCDANNELKNVDLVIPANNKGRKALATVYWLLTREVLRHRGDKKFDLSIEDFEVEL